MVLTGNCTYFVGNCEGSPSHVKDLSTYVQNSERRSMIITEDNFFSRYTSVHMFKIAPKAIVNVCI